MNTKITLPQLIESLAELTGSSTTITETFIRELFALITDALVAKESVKIKNLGVFSRSESQPDSIVFIPDENIAKAINSPFAFFEAVELNDDVTEDILCDNQTSQKEEPAQDIQIEISQDELSDEEECIPLIESENKIEIDNSIDLDNPASTPMQEVESNDIISSAEETERNYVDDYKEDSDCEITRPTIRNRFGLGLIFGFIIGLLIGCIGTGLIMNYYKSETTTTDEETPIVIDSIQWSDSINDNTITTPDTISIVEIYDTIRPNRYLTTMARQYYGEMNFWVYIYEENKDHLKHPDRINPGTIIKIPETSKYDIDAKNPASIEKAKLKAVEIYSQYQ